MSALSDNLVSKSIRKYRIHIFRGYALIALFGFALLAFLSRQFPYFPFDLKITLAIQKINFVPFDILMKAVTFPGNGPQSSIIVITIIVGLFLLKLRWEAISVAVNAVGFFTLSDTIKMLIDRSRPASDLVKVFSTLKDPSFPSGHVLSYVSFVGFLIFLIYSLVPYSHRRTVLLAILMTFIVLIGPSRIYLGEHWFSDTLGAYILGSVWLIVTIQIYFWGRSRFFKKDPTVIPPETSNIETK